MYLLLYFFFIFVTPHIRGRVISNSLVRSSNITHDNNTSSVNTSSSESPRKDFDNTKVTLDTEGGSMVPELPSLLLPNESHSDLTIMDKEIEKSKGKSIVPRKGVHYDSVEDLNPSNILNYTKERIDSTLNSSKILDDKVITGTMQSSTMKSSTRPVPSAAENTKDVTANISISTIPVVHKKPTVLSSEAISETDRRVQLERAKSESSSKAVVSDQLASPSVKFEPATHSSHPDLVMPIVITMLVVPMFAVLGYMALRRGQEAWKNRHYKRMDFLLDDLFYMVEIFLPQFYNFMLLQYTVQNKDLSNCASELKAKIFFKCAGKRAKIFIQKHQF